VGRQSAVGQVLAQYDMNKITPQRFSEMLQRLRDTGALSENDLRELGQIRLDLDNAHVEPDEQINLLEFYGDRLQDVHKKQAMLDPNTAQPGEQAALRQSEKVVQRRLDWVEKFAAIHRSPQTVGLDMVA
jgi:hypothetical protein